MVGLVFGVGVYLAFRLDALLRGYGLRFDGMGELMAYGQAFGLIINTALGSAIGLLVGPSWACSWDCWSAD